MDSKRIEVPLKHGKKMRKRRELDALIAHSLTKRSTRRGVVGPMQSQDKLLSGSTDDPEDYSWNNIKMGRRQNRKILYYRMCSPILCIIGIALLIGMYWLYFDLRRQLYDYRQRIEEVSATSKNFPDTLQKWHETSSFLIRNQSTILSKIKELQNTLETLQSNYSRLDQNIKGQQNYAKEEQIVADFGAKIESVATDVESIKERFNVFSKSQKQIEIEIEKIKVNISFLSQSRAESIPENFLEKVNLVKSLLTNNFKVLESNVVVINDTFTQKTNILSDELSAHKIKLDDLLERSENITSHVTTISNILPEYRLKINTLDTTLNKVEKEMSLTRNAFNQFETTVDNLSKICKNNSSETVNSSQTNTDTNVIYTTTASPLDLKPVKSIHSDKLSTEPPFTN